MRVRKLFLFEGIVQGVGFRPFIWRLAHRNRLAGFVRNRSDGVAVEVEGPSDAVEAFLAGIREGLPPLAELVRVTQVELPVKNRPGEGFTIAANDAKPPRSTHISPDTATCEACLAELFDPANRRYRYPFINCTNCGPRLTIIDAIPYDRVHTSMACFPLCPRCRREYEDPADRRFHAEPNACPDCGPRLELLDHRGRAVSGEDPILSTLSLLRKGAVVALKGLGGFHLCVDGRSDEAVSTLRRRKFREEKPMAVMVRDAEAAAAFAEVGHAERELLTAPERPIVLIRRQRGAPLSPLVAPGMDTLGIMLPYTPLQHLLMAGELKVLVMTSANRTDEPICIGNREALRRLEGIADAFLIHNRDILVRCDDSVFTTTAEGPYPIRRSRGYAPRPIPLRGPCPEVLALGPQIKVAICVVKKGFAFLSPHIGDMETPEARDFLQESIDLLERITECRPSLVACDLHPDYHTSRVAQGMGRRIFPVQHHHAHIVSCMAENRLSGPVIGLAMDGTGFGADGQVWGGEFLTADERTFVRQGHLRYVPLPGGERAIREPWRIAASLLREAFGAAWIEWARRLNLYPGEISSAGPGEGTAEAAFAGIERAVSGGINAPWTSSLGRVFDGVAALLGLRRRVSFEGQAAMELEGLARGETDIALPFHIAEAPAAGPGTEDALPNSAAKTLDLRPAVRTIAEQVLAGRPRTEIALAFHQLLPEALTAVTRMIRDETGLNRVVLSGGCFQNRLLLAGCLASLRRAGFETYHHRLVPTNDGGISLGQAVCAGANQESTR